MVGDIAVAVPGRASARIAWTLADTAFVLFLLVVFVGLSPFATRDPVALATGTAGSGGAGDLVREIVYSGVFLLVAVAALRANGLRGFLCLSPSFATLLLWCALSAAWAPVPDVAFRRAMLELLIVLSAMISVETLGMERSLSLLRDVLAVVLVVDWISIPLVPNAVHLAGEIDPRLVGDWRGVYFHKNIAGSVGATTAILFFFQALKSRHVWNGAIFLGAVGFTLMTGSRASLGVLAIAAALACAYRFGWRRGIDRAILIAGLVLATLVIGLVAANAWEQISFALSDPAELTGRTAIWQGEVRFIRDHFLLGAGFGSFADTGAASLLHNYVADRWVQNVSQGHNGYLQMLVTVGAIGFALAMAALVIAPAHEFWRFDPAGVESKSVLFALFVFAVLHNFLESDFFEGDDPAWVVFLLMLAMLRMETPARIGPCKAVP